MLREKLKLSSLLQRWKLPSKFISGKILKLKDKPSLIQLEENNLRRNAMTY